MCLLVIFHGTWKCLSSRSYSQTHDGRVINFDLGIRHFVLQSVNIEGKSVLLQNDNKLITVN